MSAEKKPKCSDCGGTLSQYELADNIYAGIDESLYICYSCQSEIQVDGQLNLDDDEE